MKTSEFKKRLQELDFYHVDYRTVTEVHSKDTRQTPHASISRDLSNIVAINTPHIDVAKLCIEYAETPISEREEEKKYYVILPDKERESCLDIVPALKRFEGKIIIVLEEMRKVSAKRWFHLTEEEIKRNHEYLWQFAKEVAE